MAILAGTTELVGGLAFAFGLLTPAAAALLSAVMIVAIPTVHLANGVWAAENGFEYNLVLLAALFAVTSTGAGDWSLDGVGDLDVAGEGWALAELAAGILGSRLVLGLARVFAYARHDQTARAGG
jgi:putative oxidoreductase